MSASKQNWLKQFLLNFAVSTHFLIMLTYSTGRKRLLKKYIRAGGDLLLNTSLVGGQSTKWIKHEDEREREVRVIYQLTSDRQPVIN